MAGSHACSTLPESSTINSVIVVLITRSGIHTGKKPEIFRYGLETDDVWREQTGLANAGNLTGDGDGASWTGAQFFFAIAIAADVAGDGASCTEAQNFFATAVADRPAPAWAIIYLDALYAL